MSEEIKDFGTFKVQKKKYYVGPKISTNELHDQVMVVQHYEIGPSTKKVNTLCATIQIIYEEQKRVIFTSSTFIMDTLRQLDNDCFPFRARMVKINDHLDFEPINNK